MTPSEKLIAIVEAARDLLAELLENAGGRNGPTYAEMRRDELEERREAGASRE